MAVLKLARLNLARSRRSLHLLPILKNIHGKVVGDGVVLHDLICVVKPIFASQIWPQLAQATAGLPFCIVSDLTAVVKMSSSTAVAAGVASVALTEVDAAAAVVKASSAATSSAAITNAASSAAAASSVATTAAAASVAAASSAATMAAPAALAAAISARCSR